MKTVARRNRKLRASNSKPTGTYRKRTDSASGSNLASYVYVVDQDKIEFLTVAEVGDILRLSPDSVARRFEGRPGVINLGRGEEMHRRRYRQLRISRAALNKFLHEVNEHRVTQP